MEKIKTIKDNDFRIVPGMKIQNPNNGLTFEIVRVVEDSVCRKSDWECVIRCIETDNLERPFVFWLEDYLIMSETQSNSDDIAKNTFKILEELETKAAEMQKQIAELRASILKNKNS